MSNVSDVGALAYTHDLPLGAMALVLASGCNTQADRVTSISIDFPHGATRLLVERDGETYLFYGALPQYQ